MISALAKPHVPIVIRVLASFAESRMSVLVRSFGFVHGVLFVQHDEIDITHQRVVVVMVSQQAVTYCLLPADVSMRQHSRQRIHHDGRNGGVCRSHDGMLFVSGIIDVHLERLAVGHENVRGHIVRTLLSMVRSHRIGRRRCDMHTKIEDRCMQT